MANFATLKLDDKEITLPVVTGSEGEKAIDISKLRADTGHITFDDGFGNTGSCTSKITYIDGEAGILRNPISSKAPTSSPTASCPRPISAPSFPAC
ncbi:MAG: gltA [Rariglobus sp.]|nr:gltA [Rariglobus sp.]